MNIPGQHTSPPDAKHPASASGSVRLPSRHTKDLTDGAYPGMKKVAAAAFSVAAQKVVDNMELVLKKEFESFTFGPVQTKFKDFSQSPGFKDLCQLHEYRGSFRRQKNEGFDICLTVTVPGSGILAFAPSGGIRSISLSVEAPENQAIGCIATLLAIPSIAGCIALVSASGVFSGRRGPSLASAIVGFGLGCFLAAGLGCLLAKVFKTSKRKEIDQSSRSDASTAFALAEPVFDELQGYIAQAADPAP